MDNSRSRPPSKYALALMAYLKDEWKATGTTQTAFARESRIEGSNFTSWSKGGEPGLEFLRTIADSLGISAVELLLNMGFLTSEEAAGKIARRETVGDIVRRMPPGPEKDVYETAIDLAAKVAPDERVTVLKRGRRKSANNP